jgi:phage shock protein A
MLNVLKTLISGARADEALTDHFAIDLIEQKIREADAGLNGAKNTLASLIIRQRNEERHAARLDSEITDLERRTSLALSDGQDELASEAAAAIAELVNERAIRQATCAQLAQRVIRTQSSVAKANRRLIDLRQGMISARAIDAEHRAQRNLSRSIGNTTAMRDAEALIKRVMNQDDPLEESDVLDEIDAGLNGASVRDRLAQAGYGDRTKVTGGDILARLKATKPQTAE